MPSRPIAVVSPVAKRRIGAIETWLAERASDEPVLLIGATAECGQELLRRAVGPRGAAFGWQTLPLARVAMELADDLLLVRGVAVAGALACEAVLAEVLHRFGEDGSLGRFAAIADSPGFARAMRQTLREVRRARLDPRTLAAEHPVLAAIAGGYAARMRAAALADREDVLEVALELAADPDARHPLLDVPLALLDLPVESTLERDFVAALARRAPVAIAVLPAGDEGAAAALEGIFDVRADADASAGTALANVQRHLFAETAGGAPRDDSLEVMSAPGEIRECVEIARKIVALAAAGHRLDRIAVLLHSVENYRAPLEEALSRAGIAAHFARGTRRPDPAGRAFVALLRCALEGLSARQFAEYLSLGEVPDVNEAGAPPSARNATERWVAPDDELLPARLAVAVPSEGPEVEALPAEGAATAAVADGTLRAPRRWEQLLVDASVIGGEERWERRLDGLIQQTQLELAALEDADGPESERLQTQRADLECLRAYAVPLVRSLAALRAETDWATWLERLAELATTSLRHPDRVLAILGELAPMEAVGPVGLREVVRILSLRLLDLPVPPTGSRYGKVFVANLEAARGLSFDVVFLPGMAEKQFPRRISEDPILLDAARAALRAAGALALDTNDDRVQRERLALRLGAGCAELRLVLSYPRLDLTRGRPRVPSFYCLEARRAAEGILPSMEDLARAAEEATATRVGWPAPARPEDAIDEAEYDLALLRSILKEGAEDTLGKARYLLDANPHLGRALRFRWRRWMKRWTPADGLVQPGEPARAALADHQLDQRSFSPTALQNYASCPYRFFLHTVQRLVPREEAEAIEEMDPLQRGSLVHEVLFQLFSRLRDEGALPVTPADLAAAGERLDAVLDEVAARHHDQLAPAIERVWQDGVASIRADLREWLRRSVEEDATGFVPWRFELSFGLSGLRDRDPASIDADVALDCGIRLRGSIDLVERHATNRALRVTDYKTGRVRVKSGAIIEGGKSLQPLFYALVAAKLFPDHLVAGGQMSYCTSAGQFTEHKVRLTPEAAAEAQRIADTVGGALAEGMLPAAPGKDECRWCDYRVVCGPYEAVRTRLKPRRELEALIELRGRR